jgi:hypothetical protein
MSYQPNVLKSGEHVLTLTPVDKDKKALDLSDTATAGATFAWLCGAKTAGGVDSTVQTKYRPATCRN